MDGRCGSDAVALLCQLVQFYDPADRETACEIGWDEKRSDDMVVIVSSEGIDFWRMLLRLVGELPA
jgi:hypothetical protein